MKFAQALCEGLAQIYLIELLYVLWLAMVKVVSEVFNDNFFSSVPPVLAN